MKLSDTTFQVLKSLAESVNPAMVLNEKGNGYVSVSNGSQSVLAFYRFHPDEAKMLPNDLAMADVSQFLKVMEEFPSCDLVFNADHAQIKGQNSQVKYYYTSLDVIPKRPDMEKINSARENMTPKLKFTLTKADMAKLRKMSTLMRLDFVSLQSHEGTVVAVLKDTSGNLNDYKMVVGVQEVPDCPETEPFVFHIQDAWKLMPKYAYRLTIGDLPGGFFQAIGDNGDSVGLEYMSALVS